MGFRLVERTLVPAKIAPLLPQTDALGGETEAFSDARIDVDCACQPAGNTLGYAGNGLTCGESGLRARQTLKLLLPRNTVIAPGDGVCLDGEANPSWRCVAVEKWSAHILARLEKRS